MLLPRELPLAHPAIPLRGIGRRGVEVNQFGLNMDRQQIVAVLLKYPSVLG